MSFENVNVTSLRNSINSCINSINYTNSKEIINRITNNDVWSTASRDNLSKSLTKLIENRYEVLENKLTNYLKIADKIEEYQRLAAMQAESQAMLVTLNSELNNLINISSNNEANNEKNSIDNIKNQITKINDEINSNEIKMSSIKNGIEGLL